MSETQSDDGAPVASASPAADPELEEELDRLGLHDDLTAVILKRASAQVMSFASPVLLLPLAYVEAAVASGFDEEILTLGLRHTVEILRAHGASLLLGESLLSLARASHGSEPLETRLQWILEGLRTFRTAKADRRLGRGYIDLATTLKAGGDYYDALHAADEAERICLANGDSGGVAAARYHCANTYRMLDQPIEALRGLAHALEVLPQGQATDRWRNQIRSERIFNNLILERLDAAEADLDAWLSAESGYAPLFYKGEVRERRGDRDGALRSYCDAVVRLSYDILKNRSDRFRRVEMSANRFMFVRALRLAFELQKSDIALSLLELANTGGRAIQAQPAFAPPDATDLERSHREAASLLADALGAVSHDAAAPLQPCQDRADLLLADRDLLTVASAAAAASGDEDIAGVLESVRQRIVRLLPSDAVLLSYAITGQELWIVAATREETMVRRTALEVPGLRILKASFEYECQFLLDSAVLPALQEQLLAPVNELLSRKRRVVISLADDVYGIPFHAMRWTGGTLMDTHAVQYVVGGITIGPPPPGPAPSSVGGRTCRFLGTPRVTYAALDELPGVESERAVVERSVPAGLLEVALPAASASLLAGDRCKILHIACHGEFEPRAPLLSRLLLADRPVFAFEIALGRLASDIAIITGCQTAAAAAAAGGYVQGLAAAFQRAGVRTVIASLWPIDDAASAVFVGKFYELLHDTERSALEAFCAAQRHLRTLDEFRHPYFWAPFVIFEDIASW